PLDWCPFRLSRTVMYRISSPRSRDPTRWHVRGWSQLVDAPTIPVMAIQTTSPVTGEVLKRFDELTPEELEDKLARAAAPAAACPASSSVRGGSVGPAMSWRTRPTRSAR